LHIRITNWARLRRNFYHPTFKLNIPMRIPFQCR
jgi:hypothetical protein